MDLLQNSLAGCSSYVNAPYATVNNAARDQLIVNSTTVNRESITLLPVYLVPNSLL
jgi:hypothetical protein